MSRAGRGKDKERVPHNPLSLSRDQGADPASFEHLGDEVLVQIFGYLDAKTLGRCAMVCRRWNRVAEDAPLWKRINDEDHGGRALPSDRLSPSLEGKKLYVSRLMSRLNSQRRADEERARRVADRATHKRQVRNAFWFLCGCHSWCHDYALSVLALLFLALLAAKLDGLPGALSWAGVLSPLVVSVLWLGVRAFTLAIPAGWRIIDFTDSTVLAAGSVAAMSRINMGWLRRGNAWLFRLYTAAATLGLLASAVLLIAHLHHHAVPVLAVVAPIWLLCAFTMLMPLVCRVFDIQLWDRIVFVGHWQLFVLTPIPVFVFFLLVALRADGYIETQWTLINIPLYCAYVFLTWALSSYIVYKMMDEGDTDDNLVMGMAGLLCTVLCLVGAPVFAFHLMMGLKLDGVMNGVSWAEVLIPLFYLVGLIHLALCCVGCIGTKYIFRID